MDLEKILKFAITAWWKDKPTLKYLLMFSGVLLALLAAIFVIFSILILGNILSITPTAIESTKIDWTKVIIPFFGFGFLLIVTVIITTTWIECLMYLRALQLSGLETAPFDFYKVIRVIILRIVELFYALLSLLDIKWLAIGLAAAALIISGIITMTILKSLSIALTVIGIILLFIYIVIVIRNAIRLLPTIALYLHYDESMFVSLKRAWKLTEGTTIKLFLYFVVGMIVVSLIGLAIEFIGIIFEILFSVFNSFVASIAYLTTYIIALSIMFVMMNFFIMKLYIELISEKEQNQKSKFESISA